MRIKSKREYYGRKKGMARQEWEYLGRKKGILIREQ